MENERYSIGKVSKIMGISVQMLRHYCDIGMIEPEHVDPATGYRYFSFDQFHYIDRARYLLKCGLKLKEIKQVLVNNDIDLLVGYLNLKREEKLDEIRNAHDVVETIDWYRDYFSHAKDTGDGTSYCVRHIETRYLVAIKCDEDYTHHKFYDLFSQIKNSEAYRRIKYLRQFTAILDYEALTKKTMKRYYVGMLAMEDPGFRSENVIELPAGEYYCFKAPILSDHWNPYLLKMFLKERKHPQILLASEYENSLKNYRECLHEVQILFEEEKKPDGEDGRPNEAMGEIDCRK